MVASCVRPSLPTPPPTTGVFAQLIYAMPAAGHTYTGQVSPAGIFTCPRASDLRRKIEVWLREKTNSM